MKPAHDGPNLMRSIVLALLCIGALASAARSDQAVVSAATSANWPQFGLLPAGTRYNGAETSINATTTPKLALRWKHALDRPVGGSPAVAGGLVCIGGGDGKVYALNFKTGAQRWVFPTAAAYLGNAPAVGGGLLYINAGTFLYALDASTGARRWTATVQRPSNQFASPLLAAGFVYISNGPVQAFDAATGKLLWTAGLHDCGGLAYGYGRVYVGCNGSVYALNYKTGAQDWTYSTGYTITSSPAVAVNEVVAATEGPATFAFNPKTGALLWRAATGSSYYSSPAIDAQNVYVGADTEIYAINRDTGSIAWAKSVNGQALSSPAAVKGVVFIGSHDGYLYGFSSAGRMLLRRALVGQINSSPTVVNGELVIGSGDGVDAFVPP